MVPIFNRLCCHQKEEFFFWEKSTMKEAQANFKIYDTFPLAAPLRLSIKRQTNSNEAHRITMHHAVVAPSPLKCQQNGRRLHDASPAIGMKYQHQQVCPGDIAPPSHNDVKFFHLLSFEAPCNEEL
jgi:hypothetical protein